MHQQSQIRNIFGTVRMIEQEVKTLEDDKPLPIRVQRDLQMLRPKLAYQYGRVQGRDDDRKKAAMGALTSILSQAIALVGSDVRRFRNFMDFFEAILAYHRRYGGARTEKERMRYGSTIDHSPRSRLSACRH